VSDHADTALDQLALADHLCQDRGEQLQLFLTAAQVHALLEVASAVREATPEYWP